MSKYHILGYARVSSREQAENCHALEQQIDRLKSAGAEDVLYDVESGANSERSQFNKLIQLVEDKQVCIVIATRWDRLTRSEVIYIQLKNLFQRSSVKIKLLDQGEVDFETASGMLNADLQAIFAVHERRMLKERVKKGFEYRRKKKAAWGRQPWGYTISDNDQYIIDTTPIICLLEQRPVDYQTFYSLSDNSTALIRGLSKGEIAIDAIEYFLKVRKSRDVLRYLYEKYGVSTRANTNLVLTPELLFWRSGQNFADWIQNPVLRGHTAYNKYEPPNGNKRGKQKPRQEWEIHENTHPDQRILSEEQYFEISHILENNSRMMGTMETRSQLTGLIICGECGSKCVNKNNQKYRYYACRSAGLGCNNKKNIRLDLLESQLFDLIIEKAKQFNSSISDSSIEKQDLESPTLKKLQEQLLGIEEMLKVHYNKALENAKQDLELQIKQELDRRDLDEFVQATAEDILSYPYITHLGFWYSLSTKERELLYSKLIKKVVVLDGEMKSIEFNISS